MVVRGPARGAARALVHDPGGAVTGLLGPSGCGKSTLMRSLVGVQRLTSRLGRGSSARRPATAPLRDRVGYVTQAASVYDDLTVTENLALLRPGPRRRRATDVDRCIEAVDLRSHADQVVGRPQRRPAVAGQPRRRAARPARPAGARRADRRPRPGAAPRPVGAVPPDRRRRRRGVRLQPRHGRGRALRPAAADARGRDHRRRQPARRSWSSTGTGDIEEAFLKIVEAAA